MADRKRVLIADYSENRRRHLAELLRLRFSNYDVEELPTEPYNPPRPINTAILKQMRPQNYDLLVAHIGGNPSGSECLKVFKEHNRKGKVVLYTIQEQIPIDDFDGLRLADKLFRRTATNEDRVFDDADKMFAIIKSVMEQPAVNVLRSSLKEPPVLAATITAIAAIIGAVIAAILKTK